MSYAQFLQWQADTFNANQLAGQQQYNNFLQNNPQFNGVAPANPYTQYVNNPATPGNASPALSSPANTAAWDASPANPANNNLGGSVSGTPSSTTDNSDFINKVLSLYGGLYGQNQFGNSFSPIFGGGNSAYNNLYGLGGQTNSTGTGLSGLDTNTLGQLLPLLLGLIRQANPNAGTYGNLGV
jgi:hypothetical protein